MTLPGDLQSRAINTIRFLSADAVQNANSGHPGLPMGVAAIAFTLWTKHLKFNPKNPNWLNRDRFILSKGHRVTKSAYDGIVSSGKLMTLPYFSSGLSVMPM